MFLLLIAAGSASAQANAAPDPMRDELRRVLLRLIESGEFGKTPPQDIAFTLDAPAQRTGNLGVVVDSANAARAADGLHVIAVSPGSTAQRMGLRAGDVITAVNGESLAGLGADGAGHALAAQRLRDRVDALADGSALGFAVKRAGSALELAGTASSVTLPPIHLRVGRDELLAAAGDAGAGRGMRHEPAGATGCGFVNVFDVAPRAQNIHGVRLLSIDGHAAGPEGRINFRIEAGHHELEIAENIERPYLSIGSRQRNASGRGVKTLGVDIAPNTTYYLGAQLHVDQRSEYKDGAYWDPVVWKQAESPCE
jgi:hypothetical protein